MSDKTILKIRTEDKAKELILNKMYSQWIKENPGLEEDIIKLSQEIVWFNTKWGTKLEFFN